jgi:N-acetylmuramoyl-L-alanine amidase
MNGSQIPAKIHTQIPAKIPAKPSTKTSIKRHSATSSMSFYPLAYGRLVHYIALGLLWVGCFMPAIAFSQEAQPRAGAIVRPLLKSGSRGVEVTELQAVLKLLGYYDGTVNGFFGDSTMTAVAQFQQAAGLGRDGIVGSATWDRLFPPDRNNSTPNSAPAPSQPRETSPQPASPATIDFPILRLGMTGAAVTRLQERLRAIGVFEGAIDGVFGAETQAAVKAAQSRFLLEADGIVGGETWSALMR